MLRLLRSGTRLEGERAWAAAALVRPGRGTVEAVVEGWASAPYRPGLLALREGPLLEAAVRGLPERRGVLLVNATGRDHPRRSGLARHLGAVLDLPTVGVTDRTSVAEGSPPERAAWPSAPLVLEGEVVGAWLRTREGVRPVAVHAWLADRRSGGPSRSCAEPRGGCGRRSRSAWPVRRRAEPEPRP